MDAGRAQAAVEFLTVYGWVILLALVAIAFLYYYGMFDPMRFVQKQCNFQTGFGCVTYRFEKIDPTTMRLMVELYDNFDYDISFQPNSTIIKTENIGKTGKANYTGNCTPTYPAIIKPGQRATCIFYITDTQAVPSLGKNSVFKIEMNYTICDTDPNYLVNGSCSAGSTYGTAGSIVTPMESYSPLSLYCGDELCNSSIGETLTTCPADCTTCGDYVCSPPKENQSSCCKDCGCPSCFYCVSGVCTYYGCGIPPGCFLADTPILTAEGLPRRISNIKLGDKLIAFTYDGKIINTTVIEVYTASADTYYVITTKNYEVKVTSEHPFYIGEGIFKTAKQLQVDEEILVFNGTGLSKEVVIGKEKVQANTTTYNLRTDWPNTYFANFIAVHNKGCLAENSLILTPEGYKKIQDLSVGDEVIGFDFAKGERVVTKITGRSIHVGRFSIYIYNGIRFAANHKVFVNNEWVEVKMVAEGTEIYEGYVYNIETGTKNYFGKNETSGNETLIYDPQKAPY